MSLTYDPATGLNYDNSTGTYYDTAGNPVDPSTINNNGGTGGTNNPSSYTAGQSITQNSDGSYTANTSGGSVPISGTDMQNLLKQFGGALSTPAAQAALNALVINNQRNVASGQAKQLQTQAVDQLITLGNAIGSQATPDLMQYINQNIQAVQQGTVSPAQALTTTQQATNQANIAIPQNITDAQNQTLSQLQQIAQQGYTPIEHAAIQQALDQIQTQTRGEQEAIGTNAQAQGQYGTGNELVQRQMASQQGANTAAQQGWNIASGGLTRAMNAAGTANTAATNMNNQTFGQQAQVASAQDTINAANAAVSNQMANANAARQQTADTTNTANAMAVQNANIAQQNTNQQNLINTAATQQNQQLAQQTLGANTVTNAGNNAAKMWSAPYATQQQLTSSLGQTTSNGTTAGGIGGSGVTTNDVINGANTLYNLFSDETLKKDKKKLDENDLQDLLDSLIPSSFKYTDEGKKLGAPEGQMHGIMAQDLEKTPMGADMVVEVKGKKAIDPQKALSMALAALSSMHGRISELEK
jgi:hypothetical protein